jgi:histidine ammonia-lyase
MIVLERADQLDRAAYDRIARDHVPVRIAPALLEGVAATRAAMLEHLAAGAELYGVTTGLGRLAHAPLAPADREAFQRTLLLRGAGHGRPLPEPVVRGAMLLRLTGFLAGAAGVSPELCAFLAARLNDGWAPVVPSRGISSAGEVVALSHLFATFAGAGEVLEDGVVTDAAEALARRGVAPYAPGLKEGLALVNGAPLAPALTAHLTARAARLLAQATLAGTLTATLCGASARPYSRRLGALKGDPGQERVHARLAALTGAAADWSDRPQAPVSFRVLPQVHGAVLDQLEAAEAQLARELRAVTDSPLFLPADGAEPAGFYPSGNFHAQALCLALDALAIGFAQVANLSEKRLHRLLDARFSGLPDQLAAAPGRQTGLIFLHKAVIGFAAENRMLAAPAAVHPVDTSGGQEDFQAFTFLAAEQLQAILDNLELILASELVAARQARHLRGTALPAPLEAELERLTAGVDPVHDDRPLSADVERVRTRLAP